MLVHLALLAMAGQPTGHSEPAQARQPETMTTIEKFLEDQTDSKHAAYMADVCESAHEKAMKKGLPQAWVDESKKRNWNKRYEYMAMMHDCTIYEVGRVAGRADEAADQVRRDSEKK